MECIPLVIAIRDFLKIAQTMNEVKHLLNNNMVRVNGIIRKEPGFPIGLMDILEIDGDYFRIVPSKYGLTLIATNESDGAIRLSKIQNKTHLKEKKLQLNLHDGSNMLTNKSELMTNDVIAINLKDNEITSTIKFDKGNVAVVTDGNNRGLVGKIDHIDKKLRTVSIAKGHEKFLVPIKYVFVVGATKPEVNLEAGAHHSSPAHHAKGAKHHNGE
jgi:small subunit ribosomal protein S4e